MSVISVNSISGKHVPVEQLRDALTERLNEPGTVTAVSARLSAPEGVSDPVELVKRLSQMLSVDFIANIETADEDDGYQHAVGVYLTLFFPRFNDSDWGDCKIPGLGVSDDILFTWYKLMYPESRNLRPLLSKDDVESMSYRHLDDIDRINRSIILFNSVYGQ